MKNQVFLFLSAIAVAMAVGACGGQNVEQAPAVDQADTTAQAVTTVEQAVDRFLVDSIANRYGSGKINIPQVVIIDRQQNGDTVNVLGDFWVFNYDIAGDTLKTVSGGSHPGLMHVKRVDGHLQVTAFDQVGDGSNFTPTAKKIFGDKFDAFLKLHADEKAREELRAKAIAAYVKSHNLPVTLYQDFGWPAIAIPAEK